VFGNNTDWPYAVLSKLALSTRRTAIATVPTMKSSIGICGLILTSPFLMILMKVKITNDKSKMTLGSSKLCCYNPANNADITFFVSKAIGFFTSYSSQSLFGLDDVDVLNVTRSKIIATHNGCDTFKSLHLIILFIRR
jgi:hypothetical protein